MCAVAGVARHDTGQSLPEEWESQTDVRRPVGAVPPFMVNSRRSRELTR